MDGGTEPVVRHGEYMHIGEILGRHEELEGRSVRVLGSLTEYDISTQTAVLTHEGAALFVDVRFWDEVLVPVRVNSLYQMIGELLRDPAVDGLKLMMRVVRNVDGLDTHLLDEVLALKAKFDERWRALSWTGT